MVSADEHAAPQDHAPASPAGVPVDDLDLPFFDYNEPGLVGEVYHAKLAAVREQGWLARSPLALVVLDHESGEFFLRAKQTAFPGREIADLFGVTGGRLREQIDANILNQTGERHRRLRALVGPAFTPRAAAHWRPVMRGFAGQLWQDMAGERAERGRAQSAGAGRAERGGGTSRAGTGECEFVAAFAKPYPSLTIAAVLGAPLADAPRLHEWSTWVQRQFDIRALGTELERIERATVELYDYVEELLELRRRQPSDDLVSALLAAEEEGEKLSHRECINLVLNVIAGGVDTTQAQLSHAMRLFAAHPAQWDLLAREPQRVPAAVAEVLRYEPITPFTARICTSQIEHRGVIFPAGSIVAICAERANREQDGGEEFDITADRDGRALTFGAGPHFCLGSNLARAELEEALTFLAPRMTGLRPAAPEQLGGVQGIYGIESLPLAWSQR